ncbi:hypothetical protein ABPG75_011584 [Micractinium tetrahymenae]
MSTAEEAEAISDPALPPQESQPGSAAAAGAARPASAHTAPSELAGASERSSRGAGGSSESQRAGEGSQPKQEQLGAGREDVGFDPEQEILLPSWQEEIAKKRRRLRRMLQRDAPEAAALCSRVTFQLVGSSRSTAKLWYVFNGRSWPSSQKLIPVLAATTTVHAASGQRGQSEGAPPGAEMPAGSGVEASGQQQQQQRLQRSSPLMPARLVQARNAAPPGASRLTASSTPGSTPGGPSAS